MREVLKSKLHRLKVTDTQLHYSGSLTLDRSLMEKVDLWEGEKVLVVNFSNGERFETYIISAPKGSGTVCVNGPAAFKAKKGDLITIMAFALTNEKVEPKVVQCDQPNK